MDTGYILRLKSVLPALGFLPTACLILVQTCNKRRTEHESERMGCSLPSVCVSVYLYILMSKKASLCTSHSLKKMLLFCFFDFCVCCCCPPPPPPPTWGLHAKMQWMLLHANIQWTVIHFFNSCLKVQAKNTHPGMTNFYSHKLYIYCICVADDRGVRDRERQAALIHFSSGQATEMTHHPPRKEPAQKCPHPRVELTAKLGKPSGETAQQLCGYVYMLLYAGMCMHTSVPQILD